jgi:hypothetical protein
MNAITIILTILLLLVCCACLAFAVLVLALLVKAMKSEPDPAAGMDQYSERSISNPIPEDVQFAIGCIDELLYDEEPGTDPYDWIRN